MAIYILTHRPIENWNTSFYTPIHMSILENPTVKIQVKDYYPRLAELNLLYNENSAAYYIWKKDRQKIKGMVQYRMIPDLTEDQIQDILKEHRFIVHTTQVQNLAWQFRRCHDPEGRLWNIILDEVRKTGIDEFTIQRWSNSAILFSRNILIAKKADYDGYMSWVWSILESIRERLCWNSISDVESYVKANPSPGEVKYRCRMIGFISERLMTLYIINLYGSVEEAIHHVYVPQYRMTMDQIPLL
jgi:hypothetical protein